MSLAGLLLPPLLLAGAAVLIWGLGLVGVAAGRSVGAVAGWLALLMLPLTWFAGGGVPVEVTAPVAAGPAPVDLRLDAVVVVFELALLVPFALLLTFQPRDRTQAALGALAGAAALITVEAGSLGLTAFGLATCASLLLVALRHEEARAVWSAWIALTAAWLLVGWAAVVLQVVGGTSAFGAVPVTVLREPVFALLALAAVLAAGLAPWRTWVSEVWTRDALAAGTLAVALMLPLGFSLLARTYLLGAGQWPSPWLHHALAALGAAVALGAALRAQAASSPRGYLAETVPLSSGLTLLALALGTPLGAVAALTSLVGLALVAGSAPLLQGDGRPSSIVASALLVGLPPGLVFGGWLLSIQAALEAGAAAGFVGIFGAAAWLLSLAASARAARLPASAAGRDGNPVTGTPLCLGAALGGGAALGALMSFLTLPAASGLIAAPRTQRVAFVTGGFLGVSTPSGGWSAALLGGSLVLVGVAAAMAARWWGWEGRLAARSVLAVVRGGRMPPLVPLPLVDLPQRCVGSLAALRLPEQYRSLIRPAALEAAAARSRPWFWVVVTMVLALAVTR